LNRGYRIIGVERRHEDAAKIETNAAKKVEEIGGGGNKGNKGNNKCYT
jgi:hypothetical protein